MIPSVKLSSKSPGKASTSHLNSWTPTASPYSSSHQTPISYHSTRSPLSPYTQSPITRPSISTSPGNSSSASPAGVVHPLQGGSPSTILQQATPPHTTKANPWPQSNRCLHNSRFAPPFPPPRTWRLHSGGKGFTSRPKDGEVIARKEKKSSTNGKNSMEDDDDDDDKIPDVVWGRMISRILFYVGVPLAIGFALLRGFDVVIEQEVWDVPKWVPFLTTFVTFGASAMGIAYGSLSTSLDAEEEGSLLGFEQVEKNWVEMWNEEEEQGR